MSGSKRKTVTMTEKKRRRRTRKTRSSKMMVKRRKRRKRPRSKTRSVLVEYLPAYLVYPRIYPYSRWDSRSDTGQLPIVHPFPLVRLPTCYFVNPTRYY